MWAIDQRQALETERGSDDERPQRVTTLTAAAADWATVSKQAQRADKYIRQVIEICQRASAEGLDDITDDNFGRLLQKWISNGESGAAGRLTEISVSTRRAWLRAVKIVLRHAVGQRWIDTDPSLGVRPPAAEKKTRTTLPVELLGQGLARRDHPWWTTWTLCAYAGLRLGEACRLRRCDVRTEHLEVRYHDGWKPKQGRERDIPLQPELQALLLDWPQKTGDYLVPEEIRDLTDKRHGQLMRDLILDCGADPRPYSPHCLRHSWISLMLATGEVMHFVREWAGHAQITTTDGYARLTIRYRAAVKDWEQGELRLLAEPAQLS
jgi:integrase